MQTQEIMSMNTSWLASIMIRLIDYSSPAKMTGH